jgi:3-isopropylmalate dehydrogenase
MLRHLGHEDAALNVERAVERDLATRGDKKRSTSEIGAALAGAIK